MLSRNRKTTYFLFPFT